MDSDSIPSQVNSNLPDCEDGDSDNVLSILDQSVDEDLDTDASVDEILLASKRLIGEARARMFAESEDSTDQSDAQSDEELTEQRDIALREGASRIEQVRRERRGGNAR